MARTRVTLAVGVLLTAFVALPICAEDLREADALLCATTSAVVCNAGGTCESGPPWKWNIPDFVVVDLEAKLMSTTAASLERRQTPIEVVRREDGQLLLQGMEHAKAFSIVIAEDIGSLSAAVIREDLVVTVFGACTPQPAND